MSQFPFDGLGKSVLEGQLSSEQAVRTCLERIEALDADVGAFVALRGDAALDEARRCDRERAAGAELGPFHGVPFAAKDIFDTAELPTEYGSPYYRGFRPARDAAAVDLLRQAGGILIGKTSTVEFAGLGAQPDTVNPYDLSRTAGGSSSGSGAAVGSGMVPLALGSQTGGSTIRPAAFCGAVGFKPTWGRISAEGMKPFAPSLDTVGLIGADGQVVTAAAQALFLPEPGIPAGSAKLRFGLYKTPYFSDAQLESRQALEEAANLLCGAGHDVTEVSGPDNAMELNHWQDQVMFGEALPSLRAEFQRDPNLAHDGVRNAVLNHKGISTADLSYARDKIAALRAVFDSAISGFDAWLTPAVPGVAVPRSQGDGLATFNRLFTALHLPCVSLPCGMHEGLPTAIQLVSSRFDDVRILAVAAAVESLIRAGNAR